MVRISQRTQRPTHPHYVECPDGSFLTHAELPPVGTKRWVIEVKAKVVVALAGGLITPAEACQKYKISIKELRLWRKALEKSGVPGFGAPRTRGD